MLDRSPSKVNIRILEQILLNMSGDLEEYYVAPEQIKVYYIFHKTNIFNILSTFKAIYKFIYTTNNSHILIKHIWETESFSWKFWKWLCDSQHISIASTQRSYFIQISYNFLKGCHHRKLH